MPTINDQPYVHDAMIRDIEARKALGAKRYGTPLQPHNGRNALLDAYEEALDLAVYLKQALIENEPRPGDHRLCSATGHVQPGRCGNCGATYEEEVPQVEVTDSRSLVPVQAPQTPVNRRRSAAKNISDPHLQSAFISEARAVMGQPTLDDAKALVGYTVTLSFNVDWPPVTGTLTEVVSHPSSPHLILDNYRERVYPLNAIQQILQVR